MLRFQQTITCSLFIVVFLCLFSSSIFAIETDGIVKGIPTLPGEDCKVDPHPSWAPQEKWVWTRICSGKAANFNVADEAYGYGGNLDPKDPDSWSANRVVRPVFLKTILL